MNVSAKQFHQTDFAGQVKTVLQQHGVEPSLLELELTEGMLLYDVANIVEVMNELHKYPTFDAAVLEFLSLPLAHGILNFKLICF